MKILLNGRAPTAVLRGTWLRPVLSLSADVAGQPRQRGRAIPTVRQPGTWQAGTRQVRYPLRMRAVRLLLS